MIALLRDFLTVTELVLDTDEGFFSVGNTD